MRTTGNEAADGANPEVDHPEHYNQHPSGVECIEVVRHMGFNLGNVVKYLWRDGLKDTEVPLQDLEKAAWYLKDEISQRNNEVAESKRKELEEGLKDIPLTEGELIRMAGRDLCRQRHNLPRTRKWGCEECRDKVQKEMTVDISKGTISRD